MTDTPHEPTCIALTQVSCALAAAIAGSLYHAGLLDPWAFTGALKPADDAAPLTKAILGGMVQTLRQTYGLGPDLAVV
jgi:hypothetical protein